jgi:hypothetical protein
MWRPARSARKPHGGSYSAISPDECFRKGVSGEAWPQMSPSCYRDGSRQICRCSPAEGKCCLSFAKLGSGGERRFSRPVHDVESRYPGVPFGNAFRYVSKSHARGLSPCGHEKVAALYDIVASFLPRCVVSVRYHLVNPSHLQHFPALATSKGGESVSA